jgi:hypothetical protein
LNQPIPPIDPELLVYAKIEERIAKRKGIDPRTLSWVRMREQAVEREQQEFLERYDLLFDHYGVERGNFRSLATKLAIDYVPGFRSAKVGRGVKWDRIDLVRLRFELEQIQRERTGRTIAEAARIAARRPHWKATGLSALTLQRRATEAGSIAEIMLRLSTRLEKETQGRITPDDISQEFAEFTKEAIASRVARKSV